MLKSKKLFSNIKEIGKMKKKVHFFNRKNRSEGNSLHVCCKSISLN